MLFNISTDRIIFIDGKQRVILPYGELEKNLPDFLYSHLPANAGLDQRSRVVVVNGPGSFTNLRIATLALNTYNMLHDFCLDFVSVGKVDWYKKNYELQITNYEKGDAKMGRYCVVYIGQKKNYWVIDLSIEQSVASSHSMNGIVKVHIDDLKEYVDKLEDDWFVDELVAEGKETMDELFGEGGYTMYSFTENYELRITNYEVVKLLEPNYMIDANIENPLK